MRGDDPETKGRVDATASSPLMIRQTKMRRMASSPHARG